ncbi:MAG: c-type cytochrome [Woeseiaceae bacterium]|nr:c-type cytochrome [Woeseiaceae bacterium]
MRYYLAIFAALGALALSGCAQKDESVLAEVYLPEGDAERGKAAFVSLGCVSCHSVVGAELPEPEVAGPVRVLLGSRTGRVRSYGDLVTSIVNPSHRQPGRYLQQPDTVPEDSASIMTAYNDVMTVTELTDLVAFLQTHYERVRHPRYKYTRYDYGRQ